MAELEYATDLKSVDSNIISVRLRLLAPRPEMSENLLRVISCDVEATYRSPDIVKVGQWRM